MGCSLMKKKKQNNWKESYMVADCQNTQQNMVSNQQIPLFKVEDKSPIQSKQFILPIQDLQDKTMDKLSSFQAHKESRKMKKNKYTSQMIEDLLGEDRECYRLKDDYRLRSLGNITVFSSPTKKSLAQNENRSIKTAKKKQNDDLINVL